jgi:hypothetical protein
MTEAYEIVEHSYDVVVGDAGGSGMYAALYNSRERTFVSRSALKNPEGDVYLSAATGFQLSVRRSTVWLERVGHPHQLGIGSGTHLVHGRPAMNFDGDFADSEIAGYLLIHLAGGDMQHDFLLAR